MYTIKETSELTGYGILKLRTMFLTGTISGYISSTGALYFTEKTVKYLKSTTKLNKIIRSVTGK